jgi:hypothetical protein
MLKVGDIILMNGQSQNKLISKILELQDYIDNGPANHAAIYVGNNVLLESYWGGVKLNPCEGIVGNKNYAILRLNISHVDEKKISKIIFDYHNSHLNSGYSYLGLASAALSAIICFLISKITFGRVYYKPVLLKEEHAPFCSELVAEIYEEYGIKLSTIHNDVTTPNDLYKSKKLDKIQDFGTVIM